MRTEHGEQLLHLKLSTAARESIGRAIDAFVDYTGQDVNRIIVSEPIEVEPEQRDSMFTNVQSIWLVGDSVLSEVKNPLADVLHIDFTPFAHIAWLDITQSASSIRTEFNFGTSATLGSLSGSISAVSPANIGVVKAFVSECIRERLSIP